jgi:3'-phosphoadenosine 5'-phosphosulfate sulfotransferase (PAPS reductase)/FAD synthetase
MRRMLGSKHASDNADWLYSAEHIEELISPAEVEAFAETARQRISEACAGRRAAYAYSGGKDSIVLADLVEREGIHDGYFAYCDLDYPEFVRWIRRNKPTGVRMMHTGLDLAWLAQHQELIFARGQLGQRWHRYSQLGPFSDMIRDNGLDILLLGHRVIDGNVCGPDGFMRRKNGETRYNPLYDWPHEAVLGYIHYHGLALPPIYGWKDGYLQGTHAWPERDFCETVEQGWREVFDIDPDIVIQAAGYIYSARRFLREVSA